MLDVARSSRSRARSTFVDINDNPMARARMNALMAAVAIERECGIETIPHVTPRDTSVMGLQSALLGAHAEGVRNVLAVTGDPPEVGDYPGASGVYEVDSIGLARVIAHLNAGTDCERPRDRRADLVLHRRRRQPGRRRPRRSSSTGSREKVEAGAQFAMTQALFDLSYLERMLERLGGCQPDPAARRRLLRAQPPAGAAAAQRGARDRRARARAGSAPRRGPDAPAVGRELAQELIDGSRALAAGVYVIPPFRRPEAALELL